jgi:hypothetical protein
MIVYRLYRFGRGGHHRSFNGEGVVGTRIMQAHENYSQHHQDIRIEDVIAYGGTFELMNFPDSKKLTVVNAISGVSLASVPPPPHEVAFERIVIDNFLFGVASVGESGCENCVVFPNKTFRN